MSSKLKGRLVTWRRYVFSVSFVSGIKTTTRVNFFAEPGVTLYIWSVLSVALLSTIADTFPGTAVLFSSRIVYDTASVLGRTLGLCAVKGRYRSCFSIAKD